MNLEEERITNLSGTNKKLITCPICLAILWEPVSCEVCESAFCGKCMASWLSDHPEKCPNRCKYKQRQRNYPLLTTLLSELTVRCQYVDKGCSAILPYEGLEKHEQQCTFKNNALPTGLPSKVPKPVVPVVAPAARQPVSGSDLHSFMFRDQDEFTWDYSQMNLINSDTKLIADQLKLTRRQQCRTLKLLNNEITASGAQHLAEMLKTNKLLYQLDLYGNQIGDFGAEALFDVLKSQNKTLQILRIQNNKITDQIVHKLIEMILSKQTILVVHMSGNQLSAENKRLILNATKGRPITVKL